MTGQRGKRCKGSNSNRVPNKVAKELGVDEEAGDDRKKISVGIEGFPVQVIGNILSRLDDVKYVTDIRFTVESPIRARRFLCLLSLRLHSVEASALQLQSFMASCKSLESLSLDCMRFRDAELTVNLTSSSLKSFSLKGMSLDSRHGNVVLEASSLESIRLLESSFRSLKLVKKGARVRSLTVKGHLWGSTVLEKVQTLELEGGPKLDNEFHLSMGEALKRCPNVRRLLVRSDEEAPEWKASMT
ncbi:unnamed protein product [Sphagnum tenellum]